MTMNRFPSLTWLNKKIEDEDEEDGSCVAERTSRFLVFCARLREREGLAGKTRGQRGAEWDVSALARIFTGQLKA